MPNKMLSKAINYLNDPQVVAQIQEFFGVDVREYERLHKEKAEKNSNKISGENLVTQPNGSAFVESHERESNGCISRHSSTKNNNADNNLSGDISSTASSVIRTRAIPLQIKNYFWYYLFRFSTELGDETFYTAFIPFLFWNIDAVVGRRVVLVWAIIMTTGQVLKDIIRWPRPACPPAVRLQRKWSEEYGMPSTHASISVAIPFSMLIFTMNRYNYSIALGITLIIAWCSLICMSRLYLGMHTVLDVIAGLLLASFLMFPLVPLVDFIDYYLITNIWALFILMCVSVAIIIYYPCSDKWTPTRGDTTMVVAVTSGINVGAWLNYEAGVMLPPSYPPPYDIIWPTYPILGRMILRTIVGFCCIFPNKIIAKSLTYKILCAIIGIDAKELAMSQNSLTNKHKTLVDLSYKFIFCFMVGIYTVYFLPRMFYIIGLDRPAFYTEM